MDTVRFRLVGQLRDDLPEGWTRSRKKVWRTDAFGVMETWMQPHLIHDIGMSIVADDCDNAFVQVDLPKLIYPNNGYLIKDQADLNRAIARLFDLLAEACVFDPEQQFPLTRLDFVTHIPLPPKTLIGAYLNFRLPRIRKDPVHYPNESLTWNGTFRRCKFYDKKQHLHGAPSTITRVEWQLMGPAITEEFKEVVTLHNLQMEKSYQVYRRLCLDFAPKDMMKKFDIPEFFAMAMANGWKDAHGITPMEHYRRNRNPVTFRRVMKKAQAIRLDNSIPWELLLGPTYASHRKIDESGPFSNIEPRPESHKRHWDRDRRRPPQPRRPRSHSRR
jgi:hypothetical protein